MVSIVSYDAMSKYDKYTLYPLTEAEKHAQYKRQSSFYPSEDY